jgi:hypothetical protein
MSAAVDGDAVALYPYLLVFPSVADVLAGGVVVAAVHLSYPRSIKVHRDCRALARVPYPVDAPVTGLDGRGPVLAVPRQLPGLLQAGVIGA